MTSSTYFGSVFVQADLGEVIEELEIEVKAAKMFIMRCCKFCHSGDEGSFIRGINSIHAHDDYSRLRVTDFHQCDHFVL